MKKLLSLLSVLTISGVAIPTTIAASPYQKEDKFKIENNNKSNLKALNRNKRQARQSNNQNPREILRGYFTRIKIGNTVSSVLERNNYFAEIQNIIRILARSNIILRINNLEMTYYTINPNNTDNNYFILPFNINERNLDVVIRASDFYVQGFITNENPIEGQPNNDRRRLYRYFRDASITSVNLPVIENQEYYAGHSEINIPNINNRGEITSHYSSLVGTTNPTVNWYTICNAFESITNWNNVNSVDLGIAILSISETMRFSQIGGQLQRSNVEDSEGNPSLLNFHWNDFRALINAWGTMSENFRTTSNRAFVLVFSMAAAKQINNCQNNDRFPRNITSSQNVCYEYSPLTFYYEKNKNDQIIDTYYNSENHHEITKWTIWDFNLKNINPLSFDKIKILFDNIDNIYTKISLGDDNNFGTKITDFFKDKYIKDIIKNVKVDNNESEINKYSTHVLIDWQPSNLISYQKIGLTFYWENGNYYLQLLIFQYAKNYTAFFPDGGGVWMGIGKGIKLYNI